MSNEPFPVSTYFSVWQLRADGWAWLEGATKRLLETDPRDGELEALTRDVGRLLDLLEPIERYWAFPGRSEFAELRRLLDTGEREQLGKAVARIDRALVDDSYHPVDGEAGRERVDERLPLASRQRRWPHFEVLVVDDESRRGEGSICD